MSNENGVVFDDIEALLDASMDDLDDLPPVGAPPSGHYNLTVSLNIEKIGDPEKDVVVAEFVVDAINELKDEEERSEVAVGQQFKQFFHLTKKDGTANKFGVGSLKQLCGPFAERLGTKNMREIINGVKQMAITATIKRTVNRKNEDQFNLTVKDIVLL